MLNDELESFEINVKQIRVKKRVHQKSVKIQNSFFVKACGKEPIYYEVQMLCVQFVFMILFYNFRKGLDLFYSLLFQWEYFWCLNLLVLLLFAFMVSRRVHVIFSF